MSRKRLIEIVFRKSLAVILAFLLMFTSLVPVLQAPFGPKKVEAAGNSCSAGALASKLQAAVGGVALDQAATFLAEMDDITGAYYDEALDRIVFVGKKNTALPEFDKDDLAVAIKALIYNQEIPAVSIENPLPSDPNMMNVYYWGGIENTRFGKVLFDADYALKHYMFGFDSNGNPLSSSVPGYKNMTERFIDKNPTPGPVTNLTRFWITPKLMSLKRDDAADAFVFETATMEVLTQPMSSNNTPQWDEAAEEFAVHHTQYFDQFAQETPVYGEAKQLAKIVSVVKWLADNNIATDFNWAKDHSPKVVATPDQIPLETFQGSYNGWNYTFTGGVVYDTANTYTQDTTQASSLKSASQAISTTKEDIHWTFTKDGQTYESVAVTSEAFRSMGSFSTSSTDMSFPTAGDKHLEFKRSYSSFSGAQNGIGRGWDFLPAELVDNKPIAQGQYSGFCPNDTFYRGKLAFANQDGIRETHTLVCGNLYKYNPDEPYYHSIIDATAPDGDTRLYTVRTKDQTEYLFEEFLSPVVQHSFKLLEIRDKNGNKITYNYDASDKLTSIEDENNHEITLNYSTVNGQELVSSIQDWTNRKVEYTYDNQGNLLTVKDPRGNITTYTYDSNFKLTGITDRDGKTVVTNTYTPEAKLATQKDAGNTTTTYSYDDINRVITLTDNLNRTEKAHYDERARVTRQYDKANAFSEYVYDIEYAPTHMIDRMGNLTVNTYDANGNITSTTYPDEKVVTYEYDNKNRVTKIIDGRYGATPKETINTYDSNGNLTQVNESGRTTTFTYDANGEMLTTTNPLSKTITWTRDNFGNKLTEKDPLNKTTNYEYDTIARLTKVTDPNNKEESYTYDNNGNMLTKTTASGVTTYEYNGENIQTKVIQPNNATTQVALNNARSVTSVTDALNNITSYNYDQYQNLTSKQDALNRTTEYVYDQLNRRTKLTTPLGKVTEWEYDSNGNIIARIDANLNATTYEYDEMNRMKKITYSDNTTVNYTYDGRGNLLTMVDPTGTTTYEYDQYDRLTKTTDSNSEVVTYEYDNADNLTKIIYPGNKAVTYAYNDAGRLGSITDWNNKVTSYTYNDNGTLASRSLPNGITTDYLYDNTNKLIDINHKKSGASLSTFAYERDNVGNIKVATESSNTTVTPTVTVTPTPPPSQNDHVIYGDALGSGWENWSWGSTINFSDTSNVHSGSNNMSWTVNSGYAGIYLHKNGNINTTDYTHFTFALKASQAGQNVQAQLWDENGATIGSPVSLSNYGGQPVASGYTVYSIPLADLGGSNRLISGILLQDISGAAQPAMYVDSMSLKAASSQPTATPTPTSTPQSTTYAYDDALTSGWENWSWGSTIDTNNTTNVHEGTKNLSWTVNSGYAGLYLHKNGNFNTTGYTDFTFALKATQANQNVQVQLWDENGSVIGSPLNVNSYGGQPTNSAYKVYTIPLQDLGGSNRQISGLMIQDITGSAQPAMYVDSVGFKAASTPSPSQQPTETSLTIYDEGLESSWQNWSWGSNINFNDTAMPNTGTKDISWEVTFGHGAIYLFNEGVNTTGYDTLKVSMRATQSGASIGIGLKDQNNNDLGSGILLSNYGGNPEVGAYKHYTIPLADLNATDKIIKGIIIQDKSGNTQPTVYVDTLKLVGTVSSGSATTTTTSYTYDLLGRLLSGDYQNDDYSYTYDNVGNMLSSTKNGQTATLTYNNDNQLTAKGSENFTYDNNGNQTARGSKTMNYSIENKLKTYSDPANAKTVQFVYDGNGERLKEKVNNTDTKQYINDVSGGLTNVLIEKDLVNNTQNYYVYGAGLTSKGGINDTDRFYYLEDGVGNIRYVSDSNGNIVKEYDYDPYGNLTEGSQQDFLFKGEQLNSDTGLYYMRARYYDPSIGRFVSKDPVEGAIMLPESQNGYSYAHNDPLNNSDPSGEALPAVLLAAWAVAEVGLSAADAWDFANTMQNPNANVCDKAWSGAFFAIGALAPGGGYGQAVKLADRASDYAQFIKKYGSNPNARPSGSEWEWRGPEGYGAWYNTKTGESLHPDLNHGGPQGAHWDYRDSSGKDWRIDLNGNITSK